MARKRLVFYRRVQFVLKRGLKLLVLAGLALAATVGAIALPPAIATAKLPIFSSPAASPQEIAQLPRLEEGMKLYREGKFPEAATVWERAVKMYEDIGADDFDRALALSYLSLAYQQTGNWQKAEEAGENSLNLLAPHRDKTLSAAQLEIFARVLNARGRLQLARGEAEAALESWKQAGEIYKNLGDEEGVTGNLLNQAQALQNLGRYRQALKVLAEVEERLKKQPDELVRATQRRSLANILRAVGDLESAKKVLEELTKDSQLPSPPEKSATLLSLGNLEKATGDRDRVLKESSPSVTPFGCAIAASQPEGLKNYTSAASQPEGLKNYTSAAESYQQAAQLNVPATNLQAQLNEMSLRVTLATLYSDSSNATLNATLVSSQRAAAQELSSKIVAQLQELPPSSAKAYAQINLAQSLACLQPDKSEIHQLLEAAARMGNRIGDKRVEAYALGKRGGVYEMNGDWENAEKFTAEALAAAQSIQAGDIAYQWQWQQGRLLKQRGENEKAIAVYEEAVQAIDSLRKNLAGINFGFAVSETNGRLAINPVPARGSDRATDAPVGSQTTLNTDIQFYFRSNVEPVYRELIELLLQPAIEEDKPRPERIERARDVLEQLQVADLETFLLCTLQPDSNRVSVEQIIAERNLKAALVYPILLTNRTIGVILKLPGQKYPLYFPPSSQQAEVLETIETLRKEVQDSRKIYTDSSKKLYEWLLEPLNADLRQNNIETLVFLLDGPLRNIPMAALYNRKTEKYLIEDYAVAITTGLQGPNFKPLEQIQLNPLIAGLAEDPNVTGFGPLPFVKYEVNQIGELLKNANAKVRLDQDFTRDALENDVALSAYNLVHMATHGKFSSNPKDTFLLTAPNKGADNRVNVNELDNLLRSRGQTISDGIELLILSACQTAAGDNRAALGLAGVAIRAGASSTIASLWNVTDRSTAEFMIQLYKELVKPNVTKAEAIRRVQINFLRKMEGVDYKYPYYWAPFVLVGNWL